MIHSDLIYVAGHRGMVGQALVRRLRQSGYHNLLLATRQELDLTDGRAVDAFLAHHRPRCLFLAAARVGGIGANSAYPAEFITQNLLIQTHVIDAAHRHGVERLMFLGSSCIYPRLCPQPMREEFLLTGAPEPTNAPYAIAKIAGLTQCEAYNRQYGTRFVAVMPTNLYGPQDNFDLDSSHVLPALLRKMHEAKVARAPEVMVWGSGTPLREFLHVDDMADACLFIMEHETWTRLTNIGSGQEISIRGLAELIRSVVGYSGELRFDPSKPDGMPRKLLDVSRLNELGWRARTELREGIEATYAWFLAHHGDDA